MPRTAADRFCGALRRARPRMCNSPIHMVLSRARPHSHASTPAASAQSEGYTERMHATQLSRMDHDAQRTSQQRRRGPVWSAQALLLSTFDGDLARLCAVRMHSAVCAEGLPANAALADCYGGKWEQVGARARARAHTHTHTHTHIWI